MTPHLFNQTINTDAHPARGVPRGKKTETVKEEYRQGETLGRRINCPFMGIGRREGTWKVLHGICFLMKQQDMFDLSKYSRKEWVT